MNICNKINIYSIMSYYAVRRGKKPGIYKSWLECQQNVIGFKNATYLREACSLKHNSEQYINNYQIKKK